MKTLKKAGIWMDHVHAEILEFSTEHKEPVKIYAADKELNHNKQLEAGFFKKLLEVVKDFDEVLLFGPTDAKIQFLNFVRTHHHFDKIKIETRNTDVLTANQKHAFVTEHFKKFIVTKL